MSGQANGQLNEHEWTDEQTDGRANKWADGQANEQMDRRTDGWIDK